MRVLWGVLLLATSLSGCATFKQATHLNNTASSDIKQAQEQYPKVVNMTQAPYLMGEEVTAQPAPDPILSETVTLVSAEPLTIRDVAGRITDMTGMPVEITGLLPAGGEMAAASMSSAQSMRGGLPPPPSAMLAGESNSAAGGGESSLPTVTLHYHGTLGGLINSVTAQTGLSSKIQDGRLVFFQVETKTFLIPALEGSVSASNQITASSGAGNSGGSGGSSGSSGSSSSNSNGQTSITSTSNTDVWSGIAKTASTVGDGAKIVADPSTGTITVTGTPAQLEQVGAWVQSLSNTLSKQVAVTIHIYSIKLNSEQNYGFSPQVDFKNAAGKVGLSVAGAPAPVVSSSLSPFSFGAQILKGKFAGTDLAVQALATLGQVSQVFSQSRVTLNGQPAAIQVAEQTGYLASSEVTTTANVGSSASLTPGSVTTGFTGTVTPRVVGDQIYLGMNMVISSLEGLKTVSSGDSSIQVPTTEDTVVSQSAVLKSGSVLMITGYNEADGNNTHNGVGSPYFPLFGGGADASTSHDLIAIVVTARTL